MRKEFIRELQLLAKYSILFVSKSNKSLRLYINYRVVNNITIKNNYLLLFILELQNKLQEVQ